MKISIHMAIMSHLSDVQEMLNLSSPVDAFSRINLVKKLVITYPNTDVEIETSELDQIWSNLNKD